MEALWREIRYNVENTPLGTAGSVKAVSDMLNKLFWSSVEIVLPI